MNCQINRRWPIPIVPSVANLGRLKRSDVSADLAAMQTRYIWTTWSYSHQLAIQHSVQNVYLSILDMRFFFLSFLFLISFHFFLLISDFNRGFSRENVSKKFKRSLKVAKTNATETPLKPCWRIERTTMLKFANSVYSSGSFCQISLMRLE